MQLSWDQNVFLKMFDYHAGYSIYLSTLCQWETNKRPERASDRLVRNEQGTSKRQDRDMREQDLV